MKIKAGVNLGGWISQYPKYDHEHFETFIQEEDIKKIASWGMDHLRLPIDYPVIESEEEAFKYKERGFNYIDNCINWCKKYNLSIVLDLHHAPGYSFDSLEESSLFDDEKMQKRFISIWQEFARRYINEGEELIFELLNEVVDKESNRWNKLAHKTIEAIREIDQERVIIYGGNYYNSIYELKNIETIDDPNIVYTFHYYLPLLFTHQKAPWSAINVDYDTNLKYPGKMIGLKEKYEANPELYAYEKVNIGKTINKEYLRGELKHALDFIEKTGAELYCGEYGVIETADDESRLKWHRDFIDLLNDYDIARAVWSYKEMDFPLVDINGEIVNEELVKIVSEK
ncbi:glycoside hydrolase family 5 protein [Natronospora cellulosivora (SeqCode)]